MEEKAQSKDEKVYIGFWGDDGTFFPVLSVPKESLKIKDRCEAERDCLEFSPGKIFAERK